MPVTVGAKNAGSGPPETASRQKRPTDPVPQAELTTSRQSHDRATSRWAFVALCGFLLLLPFGLILPGTPGSLKADESAYYLMALSLAHDADVRFEAEDSERLFDEFSDRPTRNLVVMSNDNWDTVYYGKPHLYSFFAAPFAYVAGYRGMLLFNLALLLGLIWMAARYLRLTESSGRALLFSSCFFLLSTTWNYAFWIQPEILSMFCVGGALFFGLRRPASVASTPAENTTEAPRFTTSLTSLPMAAISGALLAVATYNKPYLAPFGLVFLFGAWHHGRKIERGAALRWFGSWSAGVALSLGFAMLTAWILTGSPNFYLGGVARDSVTVCEPGVVPEGPAEAAYRASLTTRAVGLQTQEFNQRINDLVDPEGDSEAESTAIPESGDRPAAATKSWNWMFRIPPVTFGENVENLVYFFVGRHTGLLLYFPFAGVAILTFLLAAFASSRNRGEDRDPLAVERWTILLTGLAIGIFLLIFISWNWQGGGGFVGNRYFAPAVPAFAFLITRVRPALIAVGAVVAGLLIGPSLLSPLGLVAPEPTLQAHTRSKPLSLFPLELTLKNVPGYYSEPIAGFRLRGRKDRWLRRGESFWVHGRGETEITALSDTEVDATAFLVHGVTPEPATVNIEFAGSEASVVVAEGQSQTVFLAPTKHRRRHNPDHQVWQVYPLHFTVDRGASLAWDRYMPRNPCVAFARNDVYRESFFAGARVTILGPAKRFEEDVFSLRWGTSATPQEITTNTLFPLPTFITNTSSSTWPSSGGAAAVNLSYHWYRVEERDGVTVENRVIHGGRRTSLPKDVPPGETVGVEMLVETPAEPGLYVLELDPVYEYIGWFSDRGVEPQRHQIRVIDDAASAQQQGTPLQPADL